MMNFERITLEAMSQGVCRAAKVDTGERVRKQLQGSCQEMWVLDERIGGGR